VQVPPEALRFHIRESVGMGHASRIGHGAGVMYEDDPVALLREMAAKKVLVEIALSSNDLILGVKGRQHPLRAYLQYGVPVALVTDDGTLRYEQLRVLHFSDTMWIHVLAAMAWEQALEVGE